MNTKVPGTVEENAMKARRVWSRILIAIGAVAMLVGTVDPLEGSLLILPGSGLVLLGLLVGKRERRTLIYWGWVFGLIAFGVAAMFVLSAFGGIGGRSGQSMWWGILILPYPVGCILALAGAVAGVAGRFRGKRPAAQV